MDDSLLKLRWNSHQSGKPQASLELTADRLIFLDSAPENGGNDSDASDLPL
jgi:hypothetical protein